MSDTETRERVPGPIVLAKAALEPQGVWGAARTDNRFNAATDGILNAAAEYLLTVATK